MDGKKISVAMIIPGGIGTGNGNIGIPVLERMVRLLAVKYDVTVFQLYHRNPGFQVEGFELIDVYSVWPLMKTLKFFLAFRRVHRNKRFKVVHGFWILPGGLLATLVGKIFGIKSILSVLGGDAIAMPEIAYGQLIKPLYRKLSLWTLREVDEVTALTKYLVQNLQSVGMKPRTVHIIPWGIDTTKFVFHEKPLRMPVQFLHIANLHPVKDQETLLRTFKIITDHTAAHLTLIGTGMLESEVKRLARELGVDSYITFISFLPYDVLPEYHQRADILLHTSRSEGQSEVVTEAMSSGVVVCGTKVGLICDLESYCVAVSVGDYKVLAQNVLTLIAEPARMTNLRKQAGDWAKTHSIFWTVEQTVVLYDQL